MEDTIKEFGNQFNFRPVVENAGKLKSCESFVLGGMGGSHLAAGLMRIYNPTIDLHVHRSYGLPILSEKRYANSLYIASSYSGNTEETLDFALKALEKKYNLAVISTGGALIQFARDNGVPYIQLPKTETQPRLALGYSLVALAKLIEGDDTVAELNFLGLKLNPIDIQPEGEKLAEELRGKIPVIYSSHPNLPIAYNWKIKLNETSKIPAFYNTFSELNHNEMAGFDWIESTKSLSDKFHFIFIEDLNDHPKILHRMEITKRLYSDRGFPITSYTLKGDNIFEKIFNSLILADWTSLYVSRMYGTVPEQVTIIEEFKKLIA